MNATTALHVFLALLLMESSLAVNDPDACRNEPLGMESMRIRNDQITASSSFDMQSVGPQNGRLRTERASGAWCPKQQIRNGSYEFLQVSFDNDTLVVQGVGTQGRFGNGTGREFTQHYFIDYWREGIRWIRYRNRRGEELMHGNNDTVTVAHLQLDPPIVASKIRIVPHSVQTRTMCLRMELYGCKSLDGLLGYDLAPASEIKDVTAEQPVDGGTALGLLTDGHVAAESPPMLPSGVTSSSDWVGWSQTATKGHVNLTFHFAAAASGHSSYSHAELFAYAANRPKISLGSLRQAATSEVPASPPDNVRNDWRHFVIEEPLPPTHGRVIQLSVEFADPWFFLTEVQFKVGPSSNATTRSTTLTAETREPMMENRSAPTTTLSIAGDETAGRLNYLVAFLLSVTSLAFLSSLCGLIIYTKKRLTASKLGSASAEDSFYSRLHGGRLFSTLGGNGTPKSVMLPSSNTFAGIYQSGAGNSLPRLNDKLCRDSERSPLPSTRTAGMVIPRQRLLGHRYAYLPTSSPQGRTPAGSSTCSGSLNSRRNADTNPSPPSLMDINFPPPPPRSCVPQQSAAPLHYHNDESVIYAEPGCFPTSNSSSSILSPTSSDVLRARLMASSSSASLAARRRPPTKPKAFRHAGNGGVGGPSLLAARSGESPQRRHGWRHYPCATISLASVEMGKRIADGKFTHIHLCQLSGGARAVVKISRNDELGEECGAARQAMIAEARTMAGLEHPRILKLLGVCEDHSVVTEHAECGDIRSAVLVMGEEFDWRQVYSWCVQIAEGMQYLEGRGIIHGHLSPRSCLLSNRHSIKIASPRGPNLHAQLKYSAPEAVFLNKWSHQSDAWSYATIVWEASMRFSTPPFQSLTNREVVENCVKILSPEEADDALYLDFSHSPLAHGEPLATVARCWNSVDSCRPPFNEIYRRLLEHKEHGENMF